MNKISLVILSVILAGTASFAQARDARQPDTVVELFTSQGCSSCPPADAIMGKLVQNPDVLGLTLSVTYWDYIGWPDTFADPENDARQTQYRDQLNARYVYTPQMVIAGQNHFVGSNKHQLEENLHRFKGHAKSLELNWRFSGNHIIIDLPAHTGGGAIWQLDLDDKNDVKIRRGENRGKSVSYHNVVRKIQLLKQWDGDKQTLKLDLAELAALGREKCALLIQQGSFGPILAALVIDI